MSRARTSASADSVDTVDNSSQSYSRALRLAGTGAAAVAKGSGGVGYLLARQAFELARKGVARAKESRRDLAQIAAIDRTAVADTPKRSRPRARIVMALAAGAALAGGAVLYRKNQTKQPPPVADAPPTLGPVANGSTPPKHALRETAVETE